MCYAALIPAALSVVGGVRQGAAQEASLYSQASAARTNAGFATNAANDAMARGRYDADIQRLRTAQNIGTQRAAQAANGGVVNEGSNAVLQEDTAALGELDALTIQNNAAREAYGYKVEALNNTNAAAQLTTNAASAKRNSLLGGIIGGGTSLYSSGALGFGGTSSFTNNNRSGSVGLNLNNAYA